MDGNGRWAQARGLPRAAGHKAGLESVRELMRGCEKHRIENLTLFAFSSENWRRPKSEVNVLMELFLSAIKDDLEEIAEKNIKLRFIGDITAFKMNLQEKIRQAESRTASNNGMYLNVAVNYGGRWDIAQAARKVSQQVAAGSLSVDDINADVFAKYLSLADSPEPELLIRTSGELRISNFLIWHLAYSELYFTDCLWPDFNQQELDKAIEWFGTRKRRFGRTAEQIDNQMEQLNA